MRFAVLAAMGACALVGACIFPSLDGLSGDGGVDVADVVALIDAAITDTTTDAEAAPGPYCPQDGAIVCSDFDNAGDAGFVGDWDFSYAPGTSTLQLSTAFSVSAPDSLLAATTPADMSVGLSKNITAAQGITLAFDTYIVSLGGNPSICSFRIGNGGLSLQPHTTTSQILESTTLADGGTNYSASSSTVIVPLATWVRITLDFDRPTTTAVATVDGTIAATRKITNPTWATTTNVTIGLGIGSSANETLYYDNVTIRVR